MLGHSSRAQPLLSYPFESSDGTGGVRSASCLVAAFDSSYLGDANQTRRRPKPAGVEQSQGQDVFAWALAEPVLLVEVAGAPGVDDPLVGVEAEPRLLHGLAAAPDHAPE